MGALKRKPLCGPECPLSWLVGYRKKNFLHSAQSHAHLYSKCWRLFAPFPRHFEIPLKQTHYFSCSRHTFNYSLYVNVRITQNNYTHLYKISKKLRHSSSVSFARLTATIKLLFHINGTTKNN